MGAGTVPFESRAVGRQGAIVVAIVALHGAAILALLLDRIEVERPVEPQTQITYIPLLPVPARPAKQRPKVRSHKPTVIWPDYQWAVPLPGINVGPGAITAPPRIKMSPPSAALVRPRCPMVLKPDSPAWKRCMAGPPHKDGWQEFEVPASESLFADHWETERRKREAPYRQSCTYTSNTGGGGGGAAMVDLGCAAKSLFGGD